ncbi:MAG: ferrichrome ABC transporter permease [Verrucomicrobia bacterium]|nr:ferrichrome ABC transporter permease [Verrucomicrobiota bacterium]
MNKPTISRLIGALTIFTSAFLLFQVQPVIGKYILPWFGGTPSVWTTCLLCFQLLLLAGYAYAHGTTRWLSPRRQVLVHGCLLVAALLLLPITPSTSWQPTDTQQPALRILLLLSATVGLPYFVLSATGPLLQAWLARLQPDRSPYRLYALSNFGSLLALISYPFWFEVNFSRRAQTEWWSWGMGIFVALCGATAWFVWRHDGGAIREQATEDSAPRPEWSRYAWWLALPSCAVVMLLATTNKLCQDIAVTPMMWVLPLALYLVTFIICFDNPRWYSRTVFGAALGPAVAAILWILKAGADASIAQQVSCYCGALFVTGMVCHGELYRLKPHPRYLTAYYLLISAGGALGGVAVAVIAPVVFRTYVELHWGLGLCVALFLLVCLRDRAGLGDRGWTALAWLLGLLLLIGGEYALSKSGWPRADQFHWLVWLIAPMGAWIGWRTGPASAHRWACVLLALTALGLAPFLVKHAREETRNALSVIRNFYGVLSVWDYEKTDPQRHYRLLQHGQITHGLQFVAPERARLPASYYTKQSGIGIAVRHLPTPTNRVIGVVGLGVGTMAAYGRKGDQILFYEINPAVEQLARQHFSYLDGSPANVKVVLGDARLMMERQPSQGFDLLALDAFSGDAIPVHLLTREAFAVYLRHLRADGVLAVHISNRHLNLVPVLVKLAEEFQLHIVNVNGPVPDVESYDDDDDWSGQVYESLWVLLSREESFFLQPGVQSAVTAPEPGPAIPLWTDDYTSLFPLLQ